MEDERKKRKIGKKIGWAVLILCIIFLTIILRRLIILNSIEQKVGAYDISNYYTRQYQYSGNMLTIVETYHKENKTRTDMHFLETRKATFYEDLDTKESMMKVDNFKNNEKVVVLFPQEKMLMPKMSPTNVISSWTGMNFGQKLYTAVIMKGITTEEVNGKKCYKIDMFENNQFWLDKETGLSVRNASGTSVINGEEISMVTDYHYSFGTVTEEDVKSPDLTGYEIKRQE